VRSFYREPFQIDLYADRIEETYNLGARIALLYGIFIGGIGFVGSGSMILVLWCGARLVLRHEMSSGMLTSFVLYTITVGFALGGISGLFGSLMKAVGSNERVFELIDRLPKLPLEGNTNNLCLNHRVCMCELIVATSSTHLCIVRVWVTCFPGGDKLPKLQGHIRLEGVGFTYPSRPEVPILSDINLDLLPGTVTALVGPSGGGKSTIVSLIERFYDVEEGRILVDGHDLQSLDPAWLHRRIGLVSQEPVLFATTIRQNLTYGVEDVDEQQIWDACKMANADEFIRGFPDALDTQVRLIG
jgi:ABC-type multidrug transport system fused ATPase/permease subunit